MRYRYNGYYCTYSWSTRRKYHHNLQFCCIYTK
ncbi:hypothetical protein V6Z12_A12G170600 [Gossypium hirsutum]